MKILRVPLPTLSLLILLLTGSVAEAATHTLTLSTNGSGSVARNPTNTVYPQGATVTITALPSSGWSFSSWSGDASGSLNPLNVLMDADKIITANFSAIPNYSLTVNVSGQGSVAPSGGVYPSNTLVVLTATPSNTWVFHHWSGDAGGSANPLNLTMTGPRTVSATFVQPPHLDIQPVGVVANVGDPVSFTVVASGSASLSYQWLFNGAVFSNTPAGLLNLGNVQSARAGDYRVIVTNPYGSATSQVATLVVNCPGTNTVTVCTDAALRQAIALGGQVRFCCNGTITLTNTLTVTKDVTLDAAGQNVTISGGNTLRLFLVNTGVNFAATNLSLINGRVAGNSAKGAALLNNGGTVKLTSCVLSNHAAVASDSEAHGGAIANELGAVELHHTLLISNSASASQAKASSLGGALHSRGGSLLIDHGSFVGNRTFTDFACCGSSSGGAVYLVQSSGLITGSLFLGNSVSTPSDLAGSQSPVPVQGGALYLESGTVLLDGVRFATNTAAGGYTRLGTPSSARGGAIYNAGQMGIKASSVSWNEANAGGGSFPAEARGGGIYNSGALWIEGVTVDHNTARSGDGRNLGAGGFPGADAFGGGLHNGGGFAVTNSTWTANRVFGGNRGGGGVAAGHAFGGAIFQGAGNAPLVNVTIASNTATGGGFYSGPGGLSLGDNIAATNGVLGFRNSILAGSSNNVWGTNADSGFNLSSDGSASFNSGSSFNFTDPKLLPLAQNGGLNPTMALAADSPAIDFGSASGAPATDQRGVARPYGAGVDMGAFEIGPAIPPLAARRAGVNLNLSFAAQAGVGYRLERSSDLFSWSLHETIGVLPTNGVVQRTIPPTQTQQYFRLSLDF